MAITLEVQLGSFYHLNIGLQMCVFWKLLQITWNILKPISYCYIYTAYRFSICVLNAFEKVTTLSFVRFTYVHLKGEFGRRYRDMRWRSHSIKHFPLPVDMFPNALFSYSLYNSCTFCSWNSVMKCSSMVLNSHMRFQQNNVFFFARESHSTKVVGKMHVLSRLGYDKMC